MRKPLKPIIALNIIARRKARGFKSAKDFAEHARIPYGTLRDIEAGYSDGWRETRVAIAKALECDINDLYAPIDEEPKGVATLANIAQTEEKILGILEARLPATSIPPEIWAAWPRAPEQAQILSKLFLTGDHKYLKELRLSPMTLKAVKLLLGLISHGSAKPRSKS